MTAIVTIVISAREARSSSSPTAHALIRADRLLTLDASRYAKDFPELKQITCG